MIVLPTVPRGSTVKPKLVRWGGDLVSSLGGPTQRITRLGTRFAAEIQLPTLDGPCAARWLAAELDADTLGDTLGLIMPQLGAPDPAAQGMHVDGAAGTNRLTYTGNIGSPVGLWFSFNVGGRNYLHRVTALGVSGPDKFMTVVPLLRVTLASVPLEFDKPVLEGFTDAPPAWDVEFFRFVGHGFTITESA